MTLSVVIIAQDEERTIGDVLDAVRDIATEIILVDSGSTDRTKEIAAVKGAKVIHQDWLGFAAQKNFALSQATGDWILSLDADEILPPELVSEIKETLAGAKVERFDGFRIARLLFIGDTPVKHGGFYPDAQLRLIRRGMGSFNDRLVHESIKLTSERICDLKHHLFHYAYKDVAQFQNAMDKYAGLAAQEAQRKEVSAWKSSLPNQILHPAWTFFYRFFIRLGFLDGRLGFDLNRRYAGYVRNKILFLRRNLRKIPQASDSR